MKQSKRITTFILGVFGTYLYFKRDLHRMYYLHVQGKPLEEYDPEPIKGFI